MSTSISEVNRMMPMRRMPGMEFMRSLHKPDVSKIANRIISNRDEDGDGALSADEIGKVGEWLGLTEDDFNDDGLIDQEMLASKISEKLENMEGAMKMRGLRMHPILMIKQMAAEIDKESSEIDELSETQSSSDLVKQLLSQLDLSEEETESFLETMQNYGINVTA